MRGPRVVVHIINPSSIIRPLLPAIVDEKRKEDERGDGRKMKQTLQIIKSNKK
jgi:hypothetical protein